MSLAQQAIRLRKPVFPCAQDKRPLVRWRDEATDDPFKIARSFGPAASLIGMPTGRTSGIVVLDIDVKNGSDGTPWVRENFDALPVTRTIVTRSGGLHYWYLCPRANATIRNSASRIAAGVDIRGEGGFVIVPPSPGWSVEIDVPPVPLPEWLIEVAARPAREDVEPPVVIAADTTTRWGEAVLQSACKRISHAVVGTQSDTLFAQSANVGGFVAGGEIEVTHARTALISAGLTMISQASNPWTRGTVTDTVTRGMTAGFRSPRSAPRSDLNALDSLIRGMGGVR